MPEGTPAPEGATPDPLTALAASRSTPPAQSAPTEPAPPSGEQVPPWERDGQQFDPERAWNLITSLRGERETLRGEREQLATEVQTFRNSQLSDQQRLEQERDAFRDRSQTAEGELTRLRVAVRHGLTEEDFDLLGTGTEQEIDARAKRIADLRNAQNPPVPSFDGGQRTPAAGEDMNALLRRQLGRA